MIFIQLKMSTHYQENALLSLLAQALDNNQRPLLFNVQKFSFSVA